MNNKSCNKICTVIIYVLTIILIALILYNMFLLISTSNNQENPPKNSIKVSPISEDESSSALNTHEVFEINSKNFSISKISSIYYSDIININII